MSEPEVPHQLIHGLSKQGLVPNTTQEGHMQKLSCMLSCYLLNRFQGFLRAHASRPLLISYQADCTPSTTQETFVAEANGERVVRSGARTSEYLLHRLFGKSACGRQSVFFGPPDLLADKTVATHMRAAQPYMLFPFRHGCRTISITHCCFDGALYDSLTSAFYSAHSMAVKEESEQDDSDAGLLALTSWFLRTPCLLHSCHNALKWALREWVDDRQRMKDVWAVAASIRSSFGTLQPYISKWISARVAFRDPSDGSWPYELWCMVGLDPVLCTEMDRLKLCFSEGCLFVSSEFQDSDTVHSEIYAVLLHAFRVSEWSDSRWLGISRTSQQMLFALMLGLADFISFALANGHSSWSLGSFSKLDRGMKEFFVQAGLGSYPVSSCLDMMFEDDRVF